MVSCKESFCCLSMLTRSSAGISSETPLSIIIGLSDLDSSALTEHSVVSIFLRVVSRCSSVSNSTRNLLLETNLTLAGAKLVSLKLMLVLKFLSVSAALNTGRLEAMIMAGRVLGTAVVSFLEVFWVRTMSAKVVLGEAVGNCSFAISSRTACRTVSTVSVTLACSEVLAGVSRQSRYSILDSRACVALMISSAVLLIKRLLALVTLCGLTHS